MFDPERLLGQMLGGALGNTFGGKRGRRSAFSTGSMAGKAQIGIGLLGVAMAAWEHYSQQNRAGPHASPAGYVPVPGSFPSGATPANSTAHAHAAPPPPPGASTLGASPPPPPPAIAPTRAMPLLDERQQSIVLLIRTMIAAADADGHIDAKERDSILARARDGGLDEATLAFLEAEIEKPQSLQQVIANARPELASETYAAAALAISIDTDTQAERAWLDALAHGLNLDPTVRADLDARLAAA